MKDDLYEGQLRLIEENVNVEKTNALKDLFVMLMWIVAIIALVFIFSDCIASIFVGSMPDSMQLKFENWYATKIQIKGEKSKEIEPLEKIKAKIIAQDKSIQNKSNFDLYKIKEKEMNAFVVPNGAIYFTSGLLDEIKDERMLAFVSAHEMAHYAHRDHLKGIAREVIAALILSIFINEDTGIIINNLSEFNSKSYSRQQERNADIYAAKAIKQIYGTTQPAVDFFNMLKKEEKEKAPKLIYYFSTHPAPEQRIKSIKKI